MFSIGLGIQVSLKLLLNIKRIFKSPKMLKTTLLKKDTLNLAVFLGGFTGIFRVSGAILTIFNRVQIPISTRNF